MSTFHIVGIKVTCWQVGDHRSRPFLYEGGDETIDDCLWVVNGQLVTNTHKEPHAIETTLRNALAEVAVDERLPAPLYQVNKEVMCFEFRMIGTGHNMRFWGALDMLEKEIGLSDLFEGDIEELIRIARRDFEREKHEDGSYQHHQITLATAWQHDEFYRGDDSDEEWSYIGEIPLTGALWNCVTQLPGDQCARCKGGGLVLPVNWRLEAKDHPKCPHCIGGRVQVDDSTLDLIRVHETGGLVNAIELVDSCNMTNQKLLDEAGQMLALLRKLDNYDPPGETLNLAWYVDYHRTVGNMVREFFEDRYYYPDKYLLKEDTDADQS